MRLSRAFVEQHCFTFVKYEQSEWMEALKPIHQQEQQFYEGEADYYDLETLILSVSEGYFAVQR
jgi:hypothetical protein